MNKLTYIFKAIVSSPGPENLLKSRIYIRRFRYADQVYARTFGFIVVLFVGVGTVGVRSAGLLAGAALSWARAVGEFGATLLFAGSMPGVTQTMPLAILAALQTELKVALTLSLLLALGAVLALLTLRTVPNRWLAWR